MTTPVTANDAGKTQRNLTTGKQIPTPLTLLKSAAETCAFCHQKADILTGEHPCRHLRQNLPVYGNRPTGFMSGSLHTGRYSLKSAVRTAGNP